jgi:hypothetical protein
MIQIIVNVSNYGAAANIGGGVDHYAVTFDIENEELESALATEGPYVSKSINYEIRKKG